MENTIIVYLEVILSLFKKSKINEESLEGLIMQLALLEKVRDILGNTIHSLKLFIDRHARNQEN